ncbi:uncharacterized protein [Ptychodera flava]|uniref:uncharacterized protein n=1 Tax=Ptychodera flava TaxID=63121 RepID=UPI003969EC08
MCEESYFHCDSIECIPNFFMCDGIIDCSDESDESALHCECEGAYFLCQNGECIRKEWQCDGMNNCEDYSDEGPLNSNCGEANITFARTPAEQEEATENVRYSVFNTGQVIRNQRIHRTSTTNEIEMTATPRKLTGHEVEVEDMTPPGEIEMTTTDRNVTGHKVEVENMTPPKEVEMKAADRKLTGHEVEVENMTHSVHTTTLGIRDSTIQTSKDAPSTVFSAAVVAAVVKFSLIIKRYLMKRDTPEEFQSQLSTRSIQDVGELEVNVNKF